MTKGIRDTDDAPKRVMLVCGDVRVGGFGIFCIGIRYAQAFNAY